MIVSRLQLSSAICLDWNSNKMSTFVAQLTHKGQQKTVVLYSGLEKEELQQLLRSAFTITGEIVGFQSDVNLKLLFSLRLCSSLLHNFVAERGGNSTYSRLSSARSFPQTILRSSGGQ